MSSAGHRTRVLKFSKEVPKVRTSIPQKVGNTVIALPDGSQVTDSISNRYDPDKGHYVSGGPFYTSRISSFINPGTVVDAYGESGPNSFYYSGPVWPAFPTGGEESNLSWVSQFKANTEKALAKDGATAISLTSPTNPTSDLGTTLAETFREGVPSLPGIQSWKRRTEVAKAAGSEYLNYVFGWAPLLNEVHQVRDTARHHRDIMKNYQNGEGKNTHRRFDFPLQKTSKRYSEGNGYALEGPGNSMFLYINKQASQRDVSVVTETKKWFEGCYTYGGPSSTDSWRSAMGFGSQADHLFGLTLTPDVLWELTPWSWAVDWFSNTGDVINNVTNFGLAGLVMRYGYMMEETIQRITVEIPHTYFNRLISKSPFNYTWQDSGPASCGYEIRTKVRAPASPFGFSIGWEGLSPTQLAITAALGITKWR